MNNKQYLVAKLFNLIIIQLFIIIALLEVKVVIMNNKQYLVAKLFNLIIIQLFIIIALFIVIIVIICK